jgi:phospholipid transport system substrate-binding protein
MSYFRNFLILALIFIPIHSFSDEKIEQSKYFVENLGKQVVEKVSNINLSENERIVNFRNLYLDAFDNYYISRFVLGQYWKRLDSNMRKQFVESFNDYIVTTYAPKFKGWEGTFKATDSLLENNYYNVKMNVLNKDGPTLQFMWKIYLDKNKNFKILDVNIDGVSMLVTQRAEFMSVIKNNPKGVIGLIEAMEKKTSG